MVWAKFWIILKKLAWQRILLLFTPLTRDFIWANTAGSINVLCTKNRSAHRFWCAFRKKLNGEQKLINSFRTLILRQHYLTMPELKPQKKCRAYRSAIWSAVKPASGATRFITLTMNFHRCTW